MPMLKETQQKTPAARAPRKLSAIQQASQESVREEAEALNDILVRQSSNISAQFEHERLVNKMKVDRKRRVQSSKQRRVSLSQSLEQSSTLKNASTAQVEGILHEQEKFFKMVCAAKRSQELKVQAQLKQKREQKQDKKKRVSRLSFIFKDD
jgi:nanoRNase/pAp phosphatase (c-di-AMP/oligoRNAs hydrolase)